MDLSHSSWYSELIKALSQEAQPHTVARALLQHLDIPASQITLLLSLEQQEQLTYMLEQLESEPLAYILGSMPFRHIELTVGPGVLIPRAEPEEMLEYALPYITDDSIVCDLGTGSGALALSAALESNASQVYAIDISEEALEYCRKNVHKLSINVQKRITVVQKDLLIHSFSSVLSESEQQKPLVILANLPYIPTKDVLSLEGSVTKEPKLALDGGSDGLQLITKVLKDIIEHHKTYRSSINAWFEFDPNTRSRLESVLHELKLPFQIQKDLQHKERFLVLHLNHDEV